MTIRYRAGFFILTNCNTIHVSHNYYSPLIAIVISGAGVLLHIRTALNNTCKTSEKIKFQKKRQ
ncbi:hypothetical protein DDT56_03200 [Brenneria corticis]|uniref:Uncharacterized protein n=1 Tax=Brenneria corticis TaxID=2173106 RepID=A0A2U1UBB5_9GAMM|nr:hypothetical protein DDT56_03200 [Brenneria sp. CFCC 11842]